MAFDPGFEDNNTGISATAALAMAMFEQSGMKDAIDSQFELDIRQKLSPGNAIKAMVGDIMCMDRRKALRNVANCFRTAPLDRLFGKGVTQASLEIMSLSRNLDRLFSKDLPKLSYECYRRLADRYGLDSKVFNIDSTNFGITALNKNADAPEAAIPERCGHAKDGHHEKLVYSLLSVTDENRIVCYERPYDGSTADSELDRGEVEFLSDKRDEFHEFLRFLRIHARRRFVQKKDLGLTCKRTADFKLSLLAVREIIRKLALFFTQAEKFEQAPHPICHHQLVFAEFWRSEQDMQWICFSLSVHCNPDIICDRKISKKTDILESARNSDFV